MKLEKNVISLINDELRTLTIKEVLPNGHVLTEELGYAITPNGYDVKLENFIKKQAGKKPDKDHFLVIWGNKFSWKKLTRKLTLPNVAGTFFQFDPITTLFHDSAVFVSVKEAKTKLLTSESDEEIDESTDEDQINDGSN